MRPSVYLPRRIGLCLFVAAALAAGSPAPVPLDRQLDQLLGTLKGARVSCRVIDCATGRVLYGRNADDALVPASNMKLVTTAAALELLGADFRFVTRLGRVGRDLVAIGSGDPNISGRFFDGRITAVFERWARELKAAGLTAIEGDLVGDESLYDGQYLHPSWPEGQLQYWYCAPVGALLLNDSCLDITVLPGAEAGRPGAVKALPEGHHLTLTNRLVTAPRGERVSVDFQRRAGSAAVEVRGRIPLGSGPFTAHVTVDDPSAFFVAALDRALAAEGITVKGACRVTATPTDLRAFTPLAEHESGLAQTVTVTNKRSQNLYAETLLKQVGARSAGRPGSFETGGAAVEKFLRDIKAGRPDYVIADGSGMSRDNRLSAAHLTNLLRYMAGRPTGAVYRESLPASGAAGAGLENRLDEPPFAGRVRAKTGTLANVCALSGYLDTLDGRTLAFSLIVNDHPNWQSRAVQDDLCRVLVRSRAP